MDTIAKLQAYALKLREEQNYFGEFTVRKCIEIIRGNYEVGNKK